jgi:glycogen debranching enzyme
MTTKDLLFFRNDCVNEDDRLKQCSEDLRKNLQELNDDIFKQVQNHLNAAVENVIAGIRYFRVQADGPKLKEVSEKHPLVPR